MIKAHYDVVIVGAGPGGMATAIELAKRGASVAVFDEQPHPGGQIYRGVEATTASNTSSWLDRSYRVGRMLIDDFSASDIDYFPQSHVWYSDGPGSIAITVKPTKQQPAPL